MGAINLITAKLAESYSIILSTLPPWAGVFINLFLLTLFIVIYSVFIWKFYKLLAKKNILELNLNQYNTSTHPVSTKLLAITLYLVEYLLIMPFLIFFWFAIFTFFLIIMSKEGMEVSTILLISATIIAAIRMTAYYKEELSQDIAKLLPLTLLAFFITDLSALDLNRIINHLNHLPVFFSSIVLYLIFIILLEMILRFFDFIFSAFGLDDDEYEKAVR